jgi:ankyrin repeat protein
MAATVVSEQRRMQSNHHRTHFQFAVAVTASLALLAGCSDEPAEPQTQFDPAAVIDLTDEAGGISLLSAVRSGRLEAVREAIDSGADVNAASPDGTTPLIEAAGARRSAIVELLLEHGADVDVVNRYGMTALHLAARGADARAITALLAAGADPAVALPEGETVLMAAAKSGNPQVVAALLDGAAIATGSDYSGTSVVLNAADPNRRENWFGQTALMLAAAGNHTQAMQLLIEAGADVDAESARIDAPEIEPDRRQGGFVYAKIPEGRLTALHFAARHGHVEATQTLIDAGANLDAQDNYDTTPVVMAILNGHLGVAALLLESGADPNLQDRYGRTPLFTATDLNTLDVNPRPAPAITGDYRPADIVRLAIENGAEVDLAISDQGLPQWVAQGGSHNPMLFDGATPLFRAAMSGDIEIMNMLLEAGADPHAMTGEQPCRREDPTYCEEDSYLGPEGQVTPLMAAAGIGWRLGISRGRESDAIEAIQILLDLGADINQTNQNGNTALHGAATRHSIEIIEFLVANGADPHAKNVKGWTPLDIVLGQPDFAIPENPEVAAVLRELMD